MLRILLRRKPFPLNDLIWAIVGNLNIIPVDGDDSGVAWHTNGGKVSSSVENGGEHGWVNAVVVMNCVLSKHNLFRGVAAVGAIGRHPDKVRVERPGALHRAG